MERKRGRENKAGRRSSLFPNARGTYQTASGNRPRGGKRSSLSLGNEQLFSRGIGSDAGLGIHLYRTVITWARDRIGLGQYFRGQTEHCLFGTKGRLPYKTIYGKRIQGSTLLIAPRTIHSQKPEDMRSMIQRVSYASRIELFARQRAEGRDVWGDEVHSNIFLPSPDWASANKPILRIRLLFFHCFFPLSCFWR